METKYELVKDENGDCRCDKCSAENVPTVEYERRDFGPMGRNEIVKERLCAFCYETIVEPSIAHALNVLRRLIREDRWNEPVPIDKT